MKRLLTIILAVAMLATMLAFSASADNLVGGATGNGVEDFTPASSESKELKVKVSSLQHNYAVDLEFDVSDLTILNSIVWNAENMEYIVGASDTTKNTTRGIQVYNRSDLPVSAYVTVTDSDAADGITVASVNHNMETKLVVPKATPKSAGEAKGTTGKGSLVINVTSTDWEAVAKYYADKANNSSDAFTYATFTVTVTKNA